MMGMGQAYLGITQVAERSGLARNTVKVYAQAGRLPPADATIGRVKGWLSETIDAWLAQRKEDGLSTRNGKKKTTAITASRVIVSVEDGQVNVAAVGE